MLNAQCALRTVRCFSVLGSHKTKIPDPAGLAKSVLALDRRVLARALTLVENEVPGYEAFLDELYPAVGAAWRIGLTGPPGAGKSTLASRLIEHFVARDLSIGYVGVDPSSPFSGGAVLGDRIRLDLDEHDNVFVRSVASRGARGGLSEQTEALADVLDAAGFDILLIESVGVGQAEIEIANSVDTVVVVLVPESGDEIQAMKAGLLEIGDVLCVNKADRPSADTLYAALKQAVGMRQSPVDRFTEIVKSVATEEGGTIDLLSALDRHRERIGASNRWDQLRADRLKRRVVNIVRERWNKRFWGGERTEVLAQATESADASLRRPYALAERIITAAESTAFDPPA